MTLDKRASIKQELENARAETDRLFSLIKSGSLYERPIPQRHRMVFYLGHLEAFDWNQLAQELELKAFNPEFDKLFAFGIDPPVGQPRTDQAKDWPRAGEIIKYNQTVREKLDNLLHEAPEQKLHLALEHRLMHAETFVYMLHNLALESRITHASPPSEAHRLTPSQKMIPIPAGQVTLGRSHGAEFGWDNEFGRHVVDVADFVISKYKVTNGEYRNFVEAGATPPHFWRVGKAGFQLQTMSGEIPLPLDWPVYVTHEEATAYLKWIGKTLPTEAQFHRAAYGTIEGVERKYPWGNEPPEETRGNFDFHAWDPIPVTATPQGDSAFGVSQMIGNGWEWTSTPFHPFPDFKPFAFYPGYSAPFFDNEHYVLKGASPRTAARFLRPSFRNWFRPNYPYVFASFRYVEN